MPRRLRPPNESDLYVAESHRAAERGPVADIFDPPPPSAIAPAVLEAAARGIQLAGRRTKPEELGRRLRSLTENYDSLRRYFGDSLMALVAAWLMKNGLPRVGRCDPLVLLRQKAIIRVWLMNLRRTGSHARDVGVAKRLLPRLLEELRQHRCPCGRERPGLPTLALQAWTDSSPAERCYALLGHLHARSGKTMQKLVSQAEAELKAMVAAAPRDRLLNALRCAVRDSRKPSAQKAARAPASMRPSVHQRRGNFSPGVVKRK